MFLRNNFTHVLLISQKYLIEYYRDTDLEVIYRKTTIIKKIFGLADHELLSQTHQDEE